MANMHRSVAIRISVGQSIITASKGVARNFSRGGLSRAPGEGSPAIFQFPGGGGAQPRFFVASMIKMKEFSGQGVWKADGRDTFNLIINLRSAG